MYVSCCITADPSLIWPAIKVNIHNHPIQGHIEHIIKVHLQLHVQVLISDQGEIIQPVEYPLERFITNP